jgi:hypothetical protein
MRNPAISANAASNLLFGLITDASFALALADDRAEESHNKISAPHRRRDDSVELCGIVL